MFFLFSKVTVKVLQVLHICILGFIVEVNPDVKNIAFRITVKAVFYFLAEGSFICFNSLLITPDLILPIKIPSLNFLVLTCAAACNDELSNLILLQLILFGG